MPLNQSDSMAPSKESQTVLPCEGHRCASAASVPTSLCLNCSSTYCESCWDKQGPHQPGKAGPDGLPHEKTDKGIYERLKRILDPPESVFELSLLHQEDESTCWFGIEKDPNETPIFHDHGRFASVMADTKQPNTGMRYPQLVSFVGETGEQCLF